TLYLVWDSVIRAYSVKTGELAGEYEGLKSKAVGIKIHPTNPNAIVSCSEKGKLIQWDWRLKIPGKVVDLEFGNGKDGTVTDFLLLPASTAEDDINKCKVCVVWKNKDMDYSQVSVCCSQQGSFLRKLHFRLNDRRSLAVGGKSGEQYLAGIYKNRLQFCDTTDWKMCDMQYIGSGRTFTCVACHPEERYIATGDNTGRILLWWNILCSEKPTYTIYHWHTLPCDSVVFSHAGSSFYSGAAECVLVKWCLDSRSDKSFLPRLGAPICHLAMAPENKYLAICTTDNGIRIVNPQLNLCSTIQHFTWSVEERHGLPLFPAGIVHDPRTKSLVLNGRTGHIQIYSPHCRLDISGMNYVTQERNAVIINTEVIRIALSSDGRWLATVEHRDDQETFAENRLKFWQFDQRKQIFSLNTAVELPYNGKVMAIAFQPSQDPLQQLVVTTNSNFKFHTWCLTESTSIYKKDTLVWKCESMGYYRNLPAGDLSFSMDGSLVAVAFGPTLTVWVTETNELKCSLTPCKTDGHIK
ncbi:hypothetical protein L9F63_007691, partial [Diploptera punctata]